MSSDGRPDFTEQLERIYRRHRRQHLRSDLNEIAGTMEKTIHQRILAEEFLQESVDIDAEARQAVQDARELLAQENYDELERRLDDLRDTVETQERLINNQIQEVRIGIYQTVQGMIRLNDRLERFDDSKLDALEQLLADWNWEPHVYRGEVETFEGYNQAAAEYGRDMRRFFEEAKTAIFGPYMETPLEEIVMQVLDEDPLFLATLTDEELEQLRESDLPEYFELSLS